MLSKEQNDDPPAADAIKADSTIAGPIKNFLSFNDESPLIEFSGESRPAAFTH
jgi:hypothetical protein